MKTIDLKTPLDDETMKKLKAGDVVSVSGTIITARDRAYARALDLLRSGKNCRSTCAAASSTTASRSSKKLRAA